MNDIVSSCDRCGKEIPDGSAYICLTRNIEQIEHSISDLEDSAQILHSDLLYSMCGTCGNRFSHETLIELISIIPDDIANAQLN